MTGVARRVAVIGGGWSGLACALRLADAGVRVTLLEAAPQFGGRARRVELALGGRRYALDNGQHLMVGAYARTLALLARTGVATGQALLRLPFQLRYRDGFGLRALRLPAPWHLAGALLTATGMRFDERWSIVRSTRAWQSSGWRAHADRTAASLLADAPERVVARIWQPLCLAALNVRLADASAQMLLNVLRDTIGADARAADFLVPRHDLGRLVPDATAASLTAAGADLRCGARVLEIVPDGAGWIAVLADGAVTCDAVVLALAPPRASELLRAHDQFASARAILDRIGHAPITTVYLLYPPGVALPDTFMPLIEAPERQHFGQWVFDRGALDAGNAGVLSVVISGAGTHLQLDHTSLAEAVARQLQQSLGLPAPQAHAVIVERRATIVPAPGLRRPPPRLAAGVYLAGDAADNRYPSTLEGSIRAGEAAADACLQDFAT